MEKTMNRSLSPKRLSRRAASSPSSTWRDARIVLARIIRARIAHREAVTSEMYARLASHERREVLAELYTICGEGAGKRASRNRFGPPEPNNLIERLRIFVAPYAGLRFISFYESQTAKLKFHLLALVAMHEPSSQGEPS